jgi:hypothetical protein
VSVEPIPLVAHPNPFQNRYIPIVYKVWDLSYNGQYLATQLFVWDAERTVRARLLLHDILGTDLCVYRYLSTLPSDISDGMCIKEVMPAVR